MVTHLCALGLLLAAPTASEPARPTPPATPPAKKSQARACPVGTTQVDSTNAKGRLRYCTYKNSAGAVVRHGPLTQWQVNGKLAGTGAYRLGKRHGRFVTYDTKGNRRKVADYANGKRHGLWSRWGADGWKIIRGRYLHGRAVGRWQKWYPNGKLRSSYDFQLGKRHGRYAWYHPNGRLRYRGRYVKGYRQGCWTTWDQKGLIRARICYRDGAIHGKRVDYWPDGTVRCYRHYHQGRPLAGWRCPRLHNGREYDYGKLPKAGKNPEPVAELKTEWKHPTGWAFGMHFTGVFPYGGWTSHAYAGTLAPGDLDQIQPGGGAQLELGRKWRRVSLFFQADVAGLSSPEWMRWAESQGSPVKTTLVQYAFHLTLGVDLFHVGRFRFALRGGIGLVDIWGKEKATNTGQDYKLGFLKVSFSARFGLVGGYELANGYELLMFVDQSVGAPGVNYGTGDAKPYLALSLGVGIRFWSKRK